MNICLIKKMLQLLCCALFLVFNLGVFALPNPETPDLVGEFLKEADKYANKILEGNYTTQGYTEAYGKYEEFLDKKLNETYNILIKYLDKKNQKVLRESQRKWIIFRDAEFGFINSNWVRNSFGASYTMSRGSNKVSIVHNRVVTLLSYLQHYPYDPRKNKAHKDKVVQKKK